MTTSLATITARPISWWPRVWFAIPKLIDYDDVMFWCEAIVVYVSGFKNFWKIRENYVSKFCRIRMNDWERRYKVKFY